MKRTDLTHGEIVIVRRPHQRPCSVTMFDSLKDAIRAYSEDYTYIEYKNFADWVENSGFSKEYDSEAIEHYASEIHAAGISDYEPFVEFALNGNEADFYKASNFTEENALSEAIQDDMHGSERFDAEPNETYGDFEKRVAAYYAKGMHNAPTKAQIEYAFMLDD